MKQLLLTGLLAVGVASVAWAQTIQKVDADYGFNNIKLGSAISTHPEMVYAGLGGYNDPDLRFYERPEAAPVFAGVPLSSVRYAFYKSKLGSILLETDAGRRVALRQALTARYGKPAQYTKTYVWKGKRDTIVLVESEPTHSSVLIASAEFEAMTKERIKKQELH